MLILKGSLLGLLFFTVGVSLFLVAFLRRLGQAAASQGLHWAVDVRVIGMITIHNSWFWVALLACLALGLAIVASWPVRAI